MVSETENQRRDVLDEVLHFGGGFKDGEPPWQLEALSALVPHLARWDPNDVDVEVSVKDRDGNDQHLILRVDLTRRGQGLAIDPARVRVAEECDVSPW